ncbi:MAG TPA: hypothetical protein PKI49_03685 [Pseudomonadota bacterium]|nr:hypothetical protein [Pseudomonadota bacterium]HNI60161.1 hypothetical protein [Pseudomonadota bacterium]HNK44149.1 hypothetical protein [Pseudomonadota bacterium]HNN51474.1 hypothetical protein [Pseudomonadota bacterium]HNO67587.1 hypothetical protein [Pseudomonadota bacterium]
MTPLEPRLVPLVDQLRNTIAEMEKLTTQARSILAQIDGSEPGRDEILAERARRAVMELRAKVAATKRTQQKG